MEKRNPNSLRAYERNSRVHSAEQIDELRRSIREFGFIKPVVIDGNNMLLAGHGAVEAAKLEGLTEIPVYVAGHLTDRQKRAFVIADNKLAQKSSWDFDMLSRELSDLLEEDYDIDVLGFSDQELDALLKDDKAILPPGFDEPTVRVTTVEQAPNTTGEGRQIPAQAEGELIALGSHVQKSAIEIPKLVFGKYIIPLTTEECERLEREIKQHVDEYGTFSGFVARRWHPNDALEQD